MNFLKSTNIRTTILLLIPGTLWGFSYLLNEIILETIPPFSRSVIRNVVMVIPLIIMLYARGGRLRFRPYIFVALFDNALPGVLISWGQLYIDSGLTTILLAFTPLFTVFLAHYFSYNDKLNRQKMLGITLGLLGILLLVGPSALLNVGAHLWGQLAVIGAALSFAISAIYVRLRFQKKAKSPLDFALETLTSQLLISTVMLSPIAWIIDQPWTLQPSQASVIALFISGWGISITAMLLYYYLINTIGASATSTTLYLTPINGVFWGAVLLSEPITAAMILALLLILCGVVLVNKAGANKADLAKGESKVAMASRKQEQSQIN